MATVTVIASGTETPHKLLRILWVLAVAIVVTASLLPSTSFPMRAMDRLHISDKLQHVAAYAVIALLPAIHEKRKVLIAAAIGAVALGILLEFGQLYSGWRDFDVMDMVADAAGVAVGVAGGVVLRSTARVRRALGDGSRS